MSVHTRTTIICIIAPTYISAYENQVVPRVLNKRRQVLESKSENFSLMTDLSEKFHHELYQNSQYTYADSRTRSLSHKHKMRIWRTIYSYMCSCRSFLLRLAVVVHLVRPSALIFSNETFNLLSSFCQLGHNPPPRRPRR